MTASDRACELWHDSVFWCNYYAIDHLLLSDASMLNKLSPFAAIIFSLIFLHEGQTGAGGCNHGVAFGVLRTDH